MKTATVLIAVFECLQIGPVNITIKVQANDVNIRRSRLEAKKRLGREVERQTASESSASLLCCRISES